MSRYGIDYYGAAYYGASALVEFDASPFVAKPFDHQAIQLSWNTPTGDWSYLRLVRSLYGFPIAADDGDILFEDEVAASRSVYLDVGQVPSTVGLQAGSPYYYSIFVKENTYNTWQLAGSAIGTSVKNFNASELMYNYLPTILTSQVPHDSSVEQDNDTLKRFLKLFGLSLDIYRTDAENVLSRYDITKVHGLLVPAFMNQFGLRYEPELGLKQSRVFLRNSIRLYGSKGSKQGLEEYIKAYGGYDNIVTRGRNLMLDYNDSSFEETIGSWASVANATLLQVTTNPDAAVPAYDEPLSQSNFQNLQAGILKVTATASATTEIKLSGANARQYGVPITAGLAYSLSGYSRAATATRSVSAAISWYTKNGTLISTTTFGTGVTNSTTGWTKVSKTNAVAPADAYYAAPHFKITSTSSAEIHYFDAVQLEQNTVATYFQEARQLELTLKATRINELLNPNFEDSSDNWAFTNATTLLTTVEGDFPNEDPSVPISGGALEMYASAVGEVTMTSSSMNIFADNDYSFSLYVATTQATTYDVVVGITWYDSSNDPISTVESDPFTITTSFSRPYVTGAAPTQAVTAKVSLSWTATAINDEIAVDSALFEKSSFVNSFFDGYNGVSRLTDLFWEGNTPNAGRSHYYKNRFAVQSRLVDTIPNWTTHGTTFELLLAQPD